MISIRPPAPLPQLRGRLQRGAAADDAEVRELFRAAQRDRGFLTRSRA